MAGSLSKLRKTTPTPSLPPEALPVLEETAIPQGEGGSTNFNTSCIPTIDNDKLSHLNHCPALQRHIYRSPEDQSFKLSNEFQKRYEKVSATLLLFLYKSCATIYL